MTTARIPELKTGAGTAFPDDSELLRLLMELYQRWPKAYSHWDDGKPCICGYQFSNDGGSEDEIAAFYDHVTDNIDEHDILEALL